MILSRNTIRVGIERMPNEPASSCCSSVLILAKTTSGCASDDFSYMGAKPRQGPHQGAQKSITTIGLSLMVFSKSSFVRSTTATAESFRGEGEYIVDNHVRRSVRAVSDRSSAFRLACGGACRLARCPVY